MTLIANNEVSGSMGISDGASLRRAYVGARCVEVPRERNVRFSADPTIRWRGEEWLLRVGLASSIDAGPMAAIGAYRPVKPDRGSAGPAP
jgi:hypothetical protein